MLQLRFFRQIFYQSSFSLDFSLDFFKIPRLPLAAVGINGLMLTHLCYFWSISQAFFGRDLDE